ncbi:hypothetical protein HDU96_007162 [Phlyctochytrium bullatum]|nr:hypothetical protein HDU96_007162 [Phlyctochytrium bullatum]
MRREGRTRPSGPSKTPIRTASSIKRFDHEDCPRSHLAYPTPQLLDKIHAVLATVNPSITNTPDFPVLLGTVKAAHLLIEERRRAITAYRDELLQKARAMREDQVEGSSDKMRKRRAGKLECKAREVAGWLNEPGLGPACLQTPVTKTSKKAADVKATPMDAGVPIPHPFYATHLSRHLKRALRPSVTSLPALCPNPAWHHLTPDHHAHLHALARLHALLQTSLPHHLLLHFCASEADAEQKWVRRRWGFQTKMRCSRNWCSCSMKRWDRKDGTSGWWGKIKGGGWEEDF